MPIYVSVLSQFSLARKENADFSRFLCLDSSRSPLKITRRSLLRLLTYHQVMSEFVDFISVFGTQEGPADPMFASFCEKTSLTPNPALHIPQLGRSGRQLQLCYMLRAPAPKTNRYGRNLEWSLRPTAIHHQFDIVEGTTLWTVIRGGEDIYEKIKYLTDEFGRPEDRDMSNAATSFRASLLIHLLVAFWAMEQWKPYVVWLDSIVKERVCLSKSSTSLIADDPLDWKCCIWRPFTEPASIRS